MSFKTHVTGHFMLTDESTGNNKVQEDLSAMFTTLTGRTHKHADDLPLKATDGQVPLPLGTLSSISAILIWPEGGTVVFRHDSNANGVEITGMMLLQGTFTLPVVSTSASEITLHYVVVG